MVNTPDSNALRQLEERIADERRRLNRMVVCGAPTQGVEDALAAMYRTLQQLKARIHAQQQTPRMWA
jgi:hypothetical protein